MDHTRHVIASLTTLLFCTCAVVGAAPSPRPGEGEGEGDLSHLVKLIGKLNRLDLQAQVAAPDSWGLVGEEEEKETSGADSGQPLSTRSLSPAVTAKLAALKRGFLGVGKRQGAWSYDYGLGGGRFGKRYYGDYGIGGGRFGRDVDHVDVADTSDVTL